MAAKRDLEWDISADKVIQFVYKSGTTVEDAEPVDLTGYQLRMDIATMDSTPIRLYTFNSDDIDDPDVDEPGSQDNEATLGSDGTINIVVPRAIVLPDGPVYEQFKLAKHKFKYDIFLRDPSGKQAKLLEGVITIDNSVTLWA